MHVVHRVTKAATCFIGFFVLFLSQLFFSVVVFLFVYRDAKDVFSLFPFFFLFVLFFFLHAFFLLRSIREN